MVCNTMSSKKLLSKRPNVCFILNRDRRLAIDMPNQRSKNKLHLGGFVEKELHAEIVRLAKKEGMEFNKFGFVQKLIVEALEQRKKKRKQQRAPTAKAGK